MALSGCKPFSGCFAGVGLQLEKRLSFVPRPRQNVCHRAWQGWVSCLRRSISSIQRQPYQNWKTETATETVTFDVSACHLPVSLQLECRALLLISASVPQIFIARRGQLRRQAAAALRLRQNHDESALALTMCFLFWKLTKRRRGHWNQGLHVNDRERLQTTTHKNNEARLQLDFKQRPPSVSLGFSWVGANMCVCVCAYTCMCVCVVIHVYSLFVFVCLCACATADFGVSIFSECLPLKAY